MAPGSDPYATPLQRRVDALLCTFIVVVIALVLRTSAHGQGIFPQTVSVVPQPSWSTLSFFHAQPRTSLVLVVPAFLAEGQPDYAAANGVDISAFAGLSDNSKGEFAPTMFVQETTVAPVAPVNAEPDYAHKSFSTSNPSVADNWSHGASVGSTIPAYTAGFGIVPGTSSAASATSRQSQVVALAIDNAPRYAGESNAAPSNSSAPTSPVQQSLLVDSSAASSAPAYSAKAGTSNLDGEMTSDAITPPNAVATARVWDGGSGGGGGSSWTSTTGVNWNPNGLPVSGDTLTLDNLIVSIPISMTISISIGAQSINFANNFNGTNTALVGNGAASAVVFTFDSGWSFTNNATSGTVTFNPTNGGTGALTFKLNGSGTVSVASGGTLAWNTIIADGTSTGAISKSGTGTLVLGGANTYTGGVAINAGTLRAGSSTALGPATNATLTFGSGSTGKFQLFGNNTTVVGLNTNTLSVGTPVIENGAAGTATLTDNTTGTNTYAGLLQNGAAGTLAFTKSGNGTLTLKGLNTYTGDTQINAGDLRFDGGGSANSSTIRLGATSGSSSATLSLGLLSGNNLASTLDARSGGTGTRVLRQLATSGTNTYSGAITLSSGLTLESATGGTLLLQGGSVAFGTNTLTIDTQVDLNGANSVNMQGDITISEALTSSSATGGSLVKDGGNTLLIQSTGNTYTGNTTAGVALNTNGTRIAGGVLGIAGDTSLGLAPSVGTNNIFFTNSSLSSPPSTRTLQATGGNISLAATRNISVGNGVTGTFDSNSNVLTVNGVISNPVGNGNIAKIGAGTLALTNANTFTGTTTITAGTLQAAATGALGGTSGITVNTGGTLLLSNGGTNNRINDSASIALNAQGSAVVAFDTGGLSEHGATNNTAGLGALTLQSSSIIDMGNVASIIAFANSLVQSPNWNGTLSIYNWSGIALTGNGTDQLYFGNTSAGLSLTQLADFQFYTGPGTGAFLPGAIILPTGEVLPTGMTPVPEPGTWVAGALALLALGYTQRRRFTLAIAKRSPSNFPPRK